MLKLAFYMWFVWLFPANLFAQTWAIGFFTGGTYSYCDVSNEFIRENVQYAGYVFAKKKLTNSFSAVVNVGYIQIKGLDSLSQSGFQNQRNLNFFTDIYEVSVAVAYQFRHQRYLPKYSLRPFISFGIGLIYFIPQTKFHGKIYNLAKLRTSGYLYPQIVPVFPIRTGVQMFLTSKLQVGIDMGACITTSSDLDDIRGNSVYPSPKNLPEKESRMVYDRSKHPIDSETGYGYGFPGKMRGKNDSKPDMYFTFGVSFTYTIGDKVNLKRIHRNRFCPRFY